MNEMLRFTAGNNNIVRVLDHGWIRRNPNWYYFDLELCALSLEDYVSGNFKSILGISQFLDLAFANSHALGCLSLWKILENITNGLHFIHTSRVVHRDLKSRNGTDA